MYGVVHHNIRHELDINNDQYLLLFHIYISSQQKGYCDKSYSVIAKEMFSTANRVEKLMRQIRSKGLLITQGARTNKMRFVTVKVANFFKNAHSQTYAETAQDGKTTYAKTAQDLRQISVSTYAKSAQVLTPNQRKTCAETAHINKEIKNKERLNKGGESIGAKNPPTPTPKNQKEILEKLFFSDLKKTTFSELGLQQLKKVAQDKRIKIPSPTKILVEISKWADKTPLNRKDFYSWSSLECMSHFSWHWVPRIGNDEIINQRQKFKQNGYGNNGHNISEERGKIIDAVLENPFDHEHIISSIAV
jgi:hypothetical protein